MVACLRPTGHSPRRRCLRSPVATLALAAATLGTAHAEGWSGGVALASDKVYRGLSQSRGRASLLLDAAYRTDTGWAASIGVASLSPGVEWSLGASRSWQLDADWVLQLGAGHYGYPLVQDPPLHRYDEAFVAAAWRGRGFASFAVSPDATGYGTRGRRVGTTRDLELSWREPFGAALAATVGLGWYDLRRVSDGAYGYGSAGLAWSASRWQAHLTYATSRAAARGLADPAVAGDRWIATLLWNF